MDLLTYLQSSISPQWAEAFYRRFFTLCPEARPLFNSSPGAQAQKFSATLLVLVSESGDLPPLDAELDEMGRRHVAYGVTAEMYEHGLVALLQTLQEVQPTMWQPEWDTQVESLYRTLMAKMHTRAPL